MKELVLRLKYGGTGSEVKYRRTGSEVIDELAAR